MSWQSFGLRFLRHGRRADGAWRHRLLHLAKFGFHERVDLATDLATRRCQHGEQADVLGEVVAQRPRWYGHGAEAQVLAAAGLHGRPLPAERGEGACAASEHGDEQAGCGLFQPLDVAQNLIDPGGNLVAEGRRHRVLAMRTTRQRHLGSALGQHRHGTKDLAELPEEGVVRLAQDQEIAGLGDVLCGGPPMHPAAVGLASDP